ncbi:MAG: hypothetical protein HS111_30670 [Kofleriaceae bacterium]|nr:hypothetical protein [Kofleriaceae bacterium]
MARIARMIDEARIPVVAGPVELVQGGVGVIGRIGLRSDPVDPSAPPRYA